MYKVAILSCITFLLSLVVFAIAAAGSGRENKICYSAYTENGAHLIISDNGTPENYDDDFIADYETNIMFTIYR